MFKSKGFELFVLIVLLVLAISGRGDLIFLGFLCFLGGCLISNIMQYFKPKDK